MTKNTATPKDATTDSGSSGSSGISLVAQINNFITQHKADSGIPIVAHGKRIEFTCQKGYHYGKYSTGSGKNRKREQIGKLDKVAENGHTQRIREYLSNHTCKYPEKEYRLSKRQYGTGHEQTGNLGGGHRPIQPTDRWQDDIERNHRWPIGDSGIPATTPPRRG